VLHEGEWAPLPFRFVDLVGTQTRNLRVSDRLACSEVEIVQEAYNVMHKPAHIFVRFDKTEAGGFWRHLFEKVEGAEFVDESGPTVHGSVPVGNFNLTDTQFVEVKLRLSKSGKERVFQIPRHLVIMILEGHGKEAFDFVPRIKS